MTFVKNQRRNERRLQDRYQNDDEILDGLLLSRKLNVKSTTLNDDRNRCEPRTQTSDTDAGGGSNPRSDHYDGWSLLTGIIWKAPQWDMPGGGMGLMDVVVWD